MRIANSHLVSTVVVWWFHSTMVTTTTHAQYLNHHQQYYSEAIDDETPEGTTQRTSTTKAFTPVPKKKNSNPDTLKWAFASSIPNQKNTKLNTLLVKLGKSTPINNPFKVEFAKEYSVDRDKGGPWTIDVMDVVYEASLQEYLLCGRVIQTKKDRSEGFLLRVDQDGNFKKAKTYKKIKVFNSCVHWHNTEGVVAVGQTQDRSTSGNEPDAVYVSVEKDLETNACGLVSKGNFVGLPVDQIPNNPGNDEIPVRSAFHKVIRYKVGSKKRYAVVGETALTPDVFCESYSCAKVMVADSKCRRKPTNLFAQQYGSIFDPRDPQERGLSIAQFDDDTGGLVLTGNTVKVEDCVTRTFDSVLMIKLLESPVAPDSLFVEMMGRYSLANLFDLPESQMDDVGTSVQVDLDPLRNKESIFIGGQTDNFQFRQPDAFVLEIDFPNEENRVDVLEGVTCTSNGALFPGNLEIHLTNDTVVGMGNTQFPDRNVIDVRSLQEGSKQHPYLFERYASPSSSCFDQRFTVDRQTYDLPEYEPIVKTFQIGEVKKLKLKVKAADFANEILCPKSLPEIPLPSSEPSFSTEPSEEPDSTDTFT